MLGAKFGSRNFWKNVKNFTGFGKLKTMVNPWPDCYTTAATNSANKINSFFIESISTIHQSYQDVLLICHALPEKFICNQLSLQHVTIQDIIRIIAYLRNGNFTDNDNMSASILKYSARYICHVLAGIFNSSIDAEIFPYA